MRLNRRTAVTRSVMRLKSIKYLLLSIISTGPLAAQIDTTLRLLLHHTSGWRDYGDLPELAGEMCAIIRRIRMRSTSCAGNARSTSAGVDVAVQQHGILPDVAGRQASPGNRIACSCRARRPPSR